MTDMDELRRALATEHPWWPGPDDNCTCTPCRTYRARQQDSIVLGDRASAPADKVQVGGDHYKNFAIQPAEFITRNDIGFLEGCVIKRVCRYAEKNGREDLEKAIHELQLLMQYRYGS